MNLLCAMCLAAAAALAEGDAPKSPLPPPPPPAAAAPVAGQKAGTWVRRLAARPMEDVGKLPRLSYESSLAYDRKNRVAVMWGGHGLLCDSPQLDETWLYDPLANAWREGAPPRRPMGSCCVRDSTYDELAGRVVQLEGHSGGHGWQFTRHKGWGLRASTPWLYDAAADRWTPMRPAFGPGSRPYKALAYSPDHMITLMFSGEGQAPDTWAYDSQTNTWHDMNPVTKPPAVLGAGMCYDRRRKVFVMLANSTLRVGEPAGSCGLWTYDPATNAWKEYRPQHSPSAGPNSVLSYDEAAGQALCFSAVEAGNGQWRMQVWALDLDKADWTEVTPAGEGPAYYNHAVCYVPELNIHVIGPGHTNWQTGHPTVRETWTFRHRDGKAPAGFAGATWSLETEDKAAVINVPVGQDLPAVPVLLRAEGEQPWKLTWTEVDAKFPGMLRDEKVERGRVYWYRLKLGEQVTMPLCTRPSVPACPLVVPKGEKEVELSWPANPEKDLVGYNVYRARVKVGAGAGGQVTRLGGVDAFVKLNAEPVALARYTDKAVDLAAAESGGSKYAVYAYHVRAVNKLGVESGPSPFALTLPEQPDAPRALEAAGKLRLNWAKHPSPAVTGYNVYRIATTYEKPKKLNAEPLRETEFTDETLPGEAMRRYVLVPVDSLGQEGISSAEVWGFRKPTAQPQER